LEQKESTPQSAPKSIPPQPIMLDSPLSTLDTLHKQPSPAPIPLVPRLSSRPTKSNVRLADYICSVETKTNQSSSTCLYPLHSVLSYSNIS
jgi:hypothetical protein